MFIQKEKKIVRYEVTYLSSTNNNTYLSLMLLWIENKYFL